MPCGGSVGGTVDFPRVGGDQLVEPFACFIERFVVNVVGDGVESLTAVWNAICDPGTPVPRTVTLRICLLIAVASLLPGTSPSRFALRTAWFVMQ